MKKKVTLNVYTYASHKNLLTLCLMKLFKLYELFKCGTSINKLHLSCRFATDVLTESLTTEMKRFRRKKLLHFLRREKNRKSIT